MSFVEWAQQQKDAKKFGDILINTFSGCNKEQLSDVDFVIDTLLNKYDEDTLKWIYSIEQNSVQQGWKRFSNKNPDSKGM
jgi:hypothetical protein